MRSVICLLVLLCALSSSVSAQTTYVAGTATALTTTATVYAITPLGPFLTINSNAATTATFTFDLVADFNASFGVAGVPDGFASAGLTGQLGYRLALSAAVAGGITASLTTPAITALLAGGAAGRIGALSYDVATGAYARIPANQISVSNLGAVTLNLNTTGTFYIVTVNTAAITKAIGNSIVVVAGSAQNFTVSEGNQAALTLQNIQAAAGVISVQVSAQAAARVAVVQAAGRIAVSSIYNLTSSAALTSVELRYELAQSAQAAASYVATSAAWYKWDVQTSAWVVQANSRIEGGVVISTTTGFSEWSVQATNSTNNNAATASSSTGGAATGSSSARNAADSVTVSTATLFLVAALSLFSIRFF